jgi:hypothetical protein
MQLPLFLVLAWLLFSYTPSKSMQLYTGAQQMWLASGTSWQTQQLLGCCRCLLLPLLLFG